MNNLFLGIFNWIKDDWESNPVRCVLEIFAWFLSLTCSITLMVMLPGMEEKSLFLILYPMFITQCMIFGWAAWTRQSLGMLANYVLLTTIDTIGLIRMIIN
jgi:hypothetical protein